MFMLIVETIYSQFNFSLYIHATTLTLTRVQARALSTLSRILTWTFVLVPIGAIDGMIKLYRYVATVFGGNGHVSAWEFASTKWLHTFEKSPDIIYGIQILAILARISARISFCWVSDLMVKKMEDNSLRVTLQYSSLMEQLGTTTESGSVIFSPVEYLFEYCLISEWGLYLVFFWKTTQKRWLLTFGEDSALCNGGNGQNYEDYFGNHFFNGEV